MFYVPRSALGRSSSSSSVPSGVKAGRPFDGQVFEVEESQDSNALASSSMTRALNPYEAKALEEDAKRNQARVAEIEQPAEPVSALVEEIGEESQAASEPVHAPLLPSPSKEVEEEVVEEVEEEVAEEVEQEVVEEEGKKETKAVEHHILDDLKQKILTRADQGALYKEKGSPKKGKGRGRGKGKGKGKKAKSKAQEEDEEKEKKPASRPRRSKKDVEGKGEDAAPKRRRRESLVKTLFQSDDESWKDPAPAPAEGNEGKAKPTRKRGRSVAAKPSKEADEVTAAPVAAQGEATMAKKRSTKTKDQKSAKGEGEAKADKKTRRVKSDLPTFTHCNIVPYWSRPACGLKVPVKIAGNVAKKESKTGMTQARSEFCFSLCAVHN